MGDSIDYEKETFDIGEMSGKEIKVNPGYLIMRALIKVQDALTTDEPKAGFLKYIILVDHIEKLAQSARLLPDKVMDEIKEALEKANIKDSNDLLKQSKEANIRLGIITRHVFSSNTLDMSLKV